MTKITREVYIISDLHIGGKYPSAPEPHPRGFRICTHVDVLTHFVNSLALRSASQEPAIELVINGDFVDFLAEESPGPQQWQPFLEDPQAAVRCLETIMSRDAEFFDALGRLVQNGHHLTILLGNHDVELSFPAVRHRFESLIGVRPDSRYRFIYDGEAYVLGDALIEHGNRYDGFNTIDHDALRRLRSSQSRRLSLFATRSFQPPPGSRLVASVMNQIKIDYPFIDLLKPETEAVVPILLVLDPGYRRLLGKISQLYLEAQQHAPVVSAQPAYEGDIASNISPSLSGSSYLGDLSSSRTRPASVVPEEDALRTILESRLGRQATTDFLFAVEPPAEDDMTTSGDIASARQVSGLLRLLTARQNGTVERRLPALLDALSVLQNDKSFRRDVECAKEYLKAAQTLADAGFHYVIFGHTHLAKQVPLGEGRYYLNTGTWADFMCVPESIIAGPREEALLQLRHFLKELAAGHVQEWIKFAPTYVRLLLGPDDRVIDAQLHPYEPATV